MKISIIIPCYNIAKHLSKCINSILSQTFSDFELLLINDGSTDETLSICEKYSGKDARIKVYNHDNRGVSYTRNKGIDLAKGDYIMFIDGDDWIETDILDCLMEPGLDPNIINVCGMIHERNGKIFKNAFFYKLVSNNKLEFFQKEIISLFPSVIISSPCCKLYKRDMINTIRFDETSSYQEDLIFNLKYLQKIKKIKIVPYFKYHYVEHGVSSSNRFHPNLHKSIIAVRDLLLTLPKYSSNDKSIQSFNLDQVLKLISNYLHKDSGIGVKEKYSGIKKIVDSDIFDESKGILREKSLGSVLKFFLHRKNITGIIIYFQLKKILYR